MKRKGITNFITLGLVVILLAGIMLAGCSTESESNVGGADAPISETTQPQDEAGNEDGIVITDMMGREVKLDAPATSVVALAAADVESIFAIGAGEYLVGRGEYCNYPEEALEIQAVQSGNETNVEQIIALEPQLLILSVMAQDENQIKQFEDAGIAVFINDPQDIEGTYQSISLLGKLLGKETEAEAVVDNMKKTFADLQQKAEAAGGEPKTIYFEVSPLEFGLWTAGADTFMNEVAELLNMKNIFDDVSGWAEISEEQVLERNPDYILTVGMYFGDGPTPIESILSRSGWQNITAIKNEAILNLTADELSRPGPRLALGATLLYEFVYES
jgi:ABC-type Fe3+-hydroxamate transport system, periplasmic component